MRKRHVLINSFNLLLSLLMLIATLGCGRFIWDDLSEVDSEEVDAYLYVSVSNGVSGGVRSIVTVDPDIKEMPKEFGKGKENDIERVRVILFDSEGAFVANKIATFTPVYPTEDFKGIVRFRIKRTEGSYKAFIVTNETMLDEKSQANLIGFQGTLGEFKTLSCFSKKLTDLKPEKQFIPMVGETIEFDLGNREKYKTHPTTGWEYYQINKENEPTEVYRIWSKVEFVLTNERGSSPEEESPYGPQYKVVELRRQDIRTKAPLFPQNEPFVGKDVKSIIPIKIDENNGGDFGSKFTITDTFYAGTYNSSKDFRLSPDVTNPSAASSYYLKLEDVNGNQYEYILPIGDLLKNKNGELSGTLMERNIIYRINGYITGKDLKLVLLFRVAQEREEQLDDVYIYPQNKL